MKTVIIVFVYILIITFIVSLTGAIVYSAQRARCHAFPNPWCYADWKCLDAVGNPVPKNTPQQIVNNCSPITAERAIQLNAAGQKNIFPGNVPACLPPNMIDACPEYGVGDIDWTTCVPPPAFATFG